MELECLRCGKKFERKWNLIRHTKRRKLCKAIHMDIPYEEMLKMIEILLKNFSRNEEKISRKTEKISRKSDSKVESVQKIVNFKEKIVNFKSKNGSTPEKRVEKWEKTVEKRPKMGKKNPSRFDSEENGFDSNASEFDSESEKVENFKNISDISDDFKNLVKNKKTKKKKIKIKKESKIFKCEHCGKEFKHQSSYCRHIKHRCKMRSVVKKEKDTEYKPKIDEPDEVFYTTSSSGTTINNVYNTTVNNIQNIGTQNIIINNYGNEDISYLTTEKMWEILNKGPFASIQRTNKMIHFNKKHPENMNIKITNKKDAFVKIFKKDKWCLADKRKTIKEMMERAMNLIDEYYVETGKEKLSTVKSLTFKRFQEAYNNSVEFQQRLQEEIELMVLNGGLMEG